MKRLALFAVLVLLVTCYVVGGLLAGLVIGPRTWVGDLREIWR